MTDEQLMIAVQTTGNPKAFSELHNRHGAAMHSSLRQFFGDNESSAAEVVQITFIHIFQNRAVYSPEHTFASWAYTILNNDAINHKKHLDRLSRLLDGEQSPDSADDDYRLIDMIYFQGASYEEAATAFGLTVNATRVRLHRLLKSIRREMVSS